MWYGGLGYLRGRCGSAERGWLDRPTMDAALALEVLLAPTERKGDTPHFTTGLLGYVM